MVRQERQAAAAAASAMAVKARELTEACTLHEEAVEEARRELDEERRELEEERQRQHQEAVAAAAAAEEEARAARAVAAEEGRREGNGSEVRVGSGRAWGSFCAPPRVWVQEFWPTSLGLLFSAAVLFPTPPGDEDSTAAFFFLFTWQGRCHAWAWRRTSENLRVAGY